jgi:hypothetical protein
MAEIQDIFSEYGGAYQEQHKLPGHILKTMREIEKCRTAELGGHADVCDDCGNVLHFSYNSCRNRHCPKCQTLPKERWIDNQKHSLLNAGYFHVVFTIPDTLNTLVFHNQRSIYNILFRSVAETLRELAADKKYLGAELGFTSVLHTWGQNLMHHPHIHCIVPGGGISAAGKWVPSRKKFFIPVKVLSRKFRGKFLHHLQQAELDLRGQLEDLNDPVKWNGFLSGLYGKEWVVYCKPPFRDAACVVEYLGRYTHRVAISNSRILRVENGMVSFKWRDYKDQSRWKVMTLTVSEFIRRFLIHILPPRFVKIRHYGLLGNRNKNTKLTLCKRLTNTPDLLRKKLSTAELVQKITGKDTSVCPCCGSMQRSRAAAFYNSA